MFARISGKEIPFCQSVYQLAKVGISLAGVRGYGGVGFDNIFTLVFDLSVPEVAEVAGFSGVRGVGCIIE